MIRLDDEDHKRTLAFAGQAGFPTGLYFDLIDILEKEHFEVKKVTDWLEVNPRSDFYQDIAQKKQNIEQQAARVMSNISDMRKQLEMLRHDKRKLDRIIEHKEEGDIDTLKSDFVDLVDRNTEMSLLDLANAGKFPSIVVDFYQIESEEDIDDLDVSKGEKEVLRKKWDLFQNWMDRYVAEIRKREQMIKEELENKKASIEYYKDMLQPYAKALKRIKLGEPREYESLHDPRIVEKYSTSLAGVELYAWKEIVPETPAEERRTEAGVKRAEYFCFLDIEIKKRALVHAGGDLEVVQFEITPEIRHRKEVGEAEEELEERQEEILQSIGRMKGEIFEEDLEKEKEKERGEESSLQEFLQSAKDSLRRLFGIPKETELKGEQEQMYIDVVEDEVDKIYVQMKEAAGGLRLEKLY